MALPLPVGITPPEISFLCEMELVTVVPRQRLESLELLSGQTPTLRPPARTTIPLWLALLLHRQRRANILPPPWLTTSRLAQILETEVSSPSTFSPAPPWRRSDKDNAGDRTYGEAVVSPPFQRSCTDDSYAGALPYHWIEMGEMLLGGCAESIPDSNAIRGLLRDLREVRASKLRAGMKGLEGGGVVSLRGVGAMEVCGERGFVTGVIGGLRVLGSSREQARREREGEGGEVGGDGDDDDDDEMDL